MQHASLIPYVLPRHDGSEDISDIWTEETDPENERGELCTAFFDDWSRGPCRCCLVGVRIEMLDDDHQHRTLDLPREYAQQLLTPMTVTRLERLRARDLDEA